MLRRYLSPLLIGLLAFIWLAGAAFGVVFMRGSAKRVDTVLRGTRSFRKELLEPRVEYIQAHAFAEGSVVSQVKESWGQGVKTGSYPRGLMAPVANPSGDVRTGR